MQVVEVRVAGASKELLPGQLRTVEVRVPLVLAIKTAQTPQQIPAVAGVEAALRLAMVVRVALG